MYGDKAGVVRARRNHRLAATLDPHFDIAALQFKLGNVFLD